MSLLLLMFLFYFYVFLSNALINMLLILLYFSEYLSFSVPHNDGLFDTKLNIKLM